MADTYDDYEQRVRERAHEIWVREGKPEGRAEDHWALAREEISEAEGIQDSLKPIEPEGPRAEPLLAVESLGDLPGRLSDQGKSRTIRCAVRRPKPRPRRPKHRPSGSPSPSEASPRPAPERAARPLRPTGNRAHRASAGI